MKATSRSRSREKGGVLSAGNVHAGQKVQNIEAARYEAEMSPQVSSVLNVVWQNRNAPDLDIQASTR
jgi:hypothetical protein